MNLNSEGPRLQTIQIYSLNIKNRAENQNNSKLNYLEDNYVPVTNRQFYNDFTVLLQIVDMTYIRHFWSCAFQRASLSARHVILSAVSVSTSFKKFVEFKAHIFCVLAFDMSMQILYSGCSIIMSCSKTSVFTEKLSLRLMLMDDLEFNSFESKVN